MHAHDAHHQTAKKITKAIFQTMVEEAYEGIFVYQGHRFYYVNPAFERMLGIPLNPSKRWDSRTYCTRVPRPSWRNATLP
jgi:PAS domain-containing protein